MTPSADLVTGDLAVDRQHERILALIQAMEEAHDDAMSGHIIAIVDALIEHFGTEERLMYHADYPGLEEHRREHLHFFDVMIRLRAMWHATPRNPEARGALAGGLRWWLRHHILDSDIQMAAYLRGAQHALAGLS